MKILRDLKRYNLDFDKSLEYFNTILDDGHALSKELKNLHFKKGHFFTMLPENSNFKELYDFHGGWILPQNPIQSTYDKTNEKTSYYSWTPTLYYETGNFLFNKINLNPRLFCFFEDVVTQPHHPDLEFFNQYGIRYLDELYYIVDHKIAQPDLISSAIRHSGIIWHTVFILTENQNSAELEKNITLKNIKEFAKNTRLLVLGAYDGEGFVYWEPNNSVVSPAQEVIDIRP